jgi:perosamine synthetase
LKNKFLNSATIVLPAKLKNILKKINLNLMGVVYVVDNDNRLLGSISDGDVRRAILKKIDIATIINLNSKVVNKNTLYLHINDGIREIFKILYRKSGKKVSSIPLVDNNKKILDISTRKRVKNYPLSNLNIGEEEIENVLTALNSGWISSKGNFIYEFEKLFSQYIGGGYSVAVSSGTTALELALKTFDIKSGDEVIVPDFTFAATINSILNCGATPVIIDVHRETWTVDVKKIENLITKKTKAIMPVHIYGQPCHIDELLKIAKKYNLLIIEDAAEALGAKYKKKKIGNHFDCSCHSFYANKLITTGEGGMAVFKEKLVAQKARLIMNHGMSLKKKYYHELVGSNFRMTNIQAAIGVAQIKKINRLLSQRKFIFNFYDSKFKKRKNIELLPKNKWSQNSFWLYTLLIKNFNEIERDKFINRMLSRGVECRPGFIPMSKMKIYKKYSKEKNYISDYISQRAVSLPSSQIFSKDELNYIVKVFFEELCK